MPVWLEWAVAALLLAAALGAAARAATRFLTVRSPSPPTAGGWGRSRASGPTSPTAGRPMPAGDDVQFTVYRPRAVVPDRWYTLVAFAHLAAKRPDAPTHEPDPVEEVERQAAGVLGESQVRAYLTVTQDAPRPVPREETLTFVPEVPGAEFNPPLRSFRWTEAVHREEFRFRVFPSLAGRTARGRLSVFLGDILLAEVTLAITVGTPGEAPAEEAPTEIDGARPYRKIFASYSHRDAHVVEQIERLARALGDEYVRDWKHLRAGEVWDDRLLRMIEEADVFQLFWSRHAMESPHVRREYEHALSLGRPNFVRPTYWEDPLPADPARGLPPDALLRLHFQRIGPFLLPVIDRPPLPPSGPPDDSEWARPVEVPGYEIQGHLGRGAMGSVYLARDRTSGVAVVIKLDPPGPGDGGVFGPDVPLSHPGIVPLLAAGEVGGMRFTVRPYLEGGTLSDRLRGGPLPAHETAGVVAALADAVGYAHTWGVCHFNLKPSEVVFDGEGRPALIGFHHLRLHEGGVFGTPAYMAPEQVGGDVARLGPATDVYGLGAILYELLTGGPPFRGSSVLEVLRQVVADEPVRPRVLNPGVPYDLEAVCLMCLAKDPARRYASAAGLARDLRRWLSGETIKASPSARAFRRASPVPCLTVLATVGFVACLILAAIRWLAR